MDFSSREGGKVDREDCAKTWKVKNVTTDEHLISSLLSLSEEKKDSVNSLKEGQWHSKITLLFDAARMIMEVMALQQGYKIYNHECYIPFLKEKLGGIFFG